MRARYKKGPPYKIKKKTNTLKMNRSPLIQKSHPMIRMFEQQTECWKYNHKMHVPFLKKKNMPISNISTMWYYAYI